MWTADAGFNHGRPPDLLTQMTQLEAIPALDELEEESSKPNTLCKELQRSLDGCLAVAIVDLQSRLLIGVHYTGDHFSQAYLDMVAAAAVDMFRGDTVRHVEELLSQRLGRQINNSFEEIFVASQHTYHFMAALKEQQAAVVMVTRKTANQGLGWAALRKGASLVSASLAQQN